MFKVMPEVESWFKNILSNDALKTKWDLYYLCLMIGLASSKTSPLTSSRGDITDNFIADYKKSKNLIISLFICAELKNLGIEFSDRAMAKEILNKYLDPHQSASLSNQAFQRLNEYSYGGFLVLAERQSKPNELATFLMQYEDLFTSLVTKNPDWT